MTASSSIVPGDPRARHPHAPRVEAPSVALAVAAVGAVLGAVVGARAVRQR